MADNELIRNGSNVNFTGALDELADNAKSPKVSILPGDGSTAPISPATSTGQATNTTAVNTVATNIGATNESAASTDTATSGLNGLLKRYLQRFTTFLALLPAALTGSGNFKVAVQESVALVLAAGSALVGKVGIDQTTDGTTNKVQVGKSTAIDDAADITLNNASETAIVASDSTRREVTIVSDPANTVNIRIGKTGQVGAARGALLQAGHSITLTTTAAVYGFANAASQKVSLVILKD